MAQEDGRWLDVEERGCMAKSGGGAGFIQRRKRSGAGHVGRLARLVLQKKREQSGRKEILGWLQQSRIVGRLGLN
jgi:hypothetical protein